MTWTDWATVASILGAAIGGSAFLQAWLLGRATQAFHADTHAATQLTLKDLAKGFQESQERMDARWRDAFERLDQRADDRHREVLSALQALKG